MAGFFLPTSTEAWANASMFDVDVDVVMGVDDVTVEVDCPQAPEETTVFGVAAAGVVVVGWVVGHPEVVLLDDATTVVGVAEIIAAVLVEDPQTPPLLFGLLLLWLMGPIANVAFLGG